MNPCSRKIRRVLGFLVILYGFQAGSGCAREIPPEQLILLLDALSAVNGSSSSSSSSSSGGNKLTYVTASGHNGDFDNDAGLTGGGAVNANGNGVEEADQHCMVDGNYPGSGTYKALVADGTNRIACTSANCSGGTGEHTDWVLTATAVYFRSDGTTELFTADANGVFAFGTLTNSFGTGGPNFWTGLATDWTSSANDCTNWGGTGGSGSEGNQTATDNTAVDDGSAQGCTASRRLVCVEQ